jgi:16S rRNA (adenine1518-N6/adenine1519-N6)-dimethyltransferase
MNLSQIAATLTEIRVSPVKSLGQNFLHDQNLARWIVEQAKISNEDYVVEIGPGLGALTEVTLSKGARVLAIEKDARLARFLRAHLSTDALEVRHEDAIDFDVRTLFTRPQVKLLGNLPYYISSQLLLRFLKWPSPISLSLLMLQKEMATRLSASPGSKDYGALTLQVQLHYRVEYLRTIAPSVFIPRPDIDSAIVRLVPRAYSELPPRDDEMFRRIVRQGFSQRRKQLGKLLREYLPDWDMAATTLGLDPRVRAEELGLEHWIKLTNLVSPITLSAGEKAGVEQFSVVDEEDRVIGSAPRSQVHGDNLRHRAVHILIFNPAGEVFLQKRSEWKDRYPLAWDSSAAGHLDAGEDYDAAAARELAEELGITTPLERVAKLPASSLTGEEFIWLYRGQWDGAFQLDRAEIEAGGYFPPTVVTQWIRARPDDFAPGFVECWKAAGLGGSAG